MSDKTDAAWAIMEWKARAKAAEAQLSAARKALRECRVTMGHARIFITSRQRIKSPEGEALWNDCLRLIDEALDTEDIEVGRARGP